MCNNKAVEATSKILFFLVASLLSLNAYASGVRETTNLGSIIFGIIAIVAISWFVIKRRK